MRGMRCRKALSAVSALLMLATVVIAQPTNDDCASATVLCNQVVENGTTISATAECGGADGDCTAAGTWAGCYDVQGSVWYQFETVPAGGTVTISIDIINSVNPTDSVNAVLIAAGTACDASTYTSVHCLSDTTGSFELTGTLTGNTVYYVQLANSADTGTVAGSNYTISASGPGMTPTFTETITPPECPGGSDGNAHVGTNFGTAPFQYAWSNGVSGQTTGGLSAGNYTVTVTDSAGCQAMDTITIVDPTPITVQFFAQDATCGLTDGAISAVASGAQPFDYSWSTGANTAAITNVAAGAYSITISDNDGCLLETVGFVNSTGGPTVTTTAIDVQCNGGSDGSAAATATGGNPPYTYAWNDPGNQTTVQANNLSAGEYVVVVTDGSGCVASASATVTEPELLTGTTTTTPETCTGADGTATVFPTGGTVPITYLWSNGAASFGAINLATGNYNVTITDANNCTETFLAVVDQQTEVGNLDLTPTETECDGATGTIISAASGGTFPYMYALDGGASTPVNTFGGLPIGTYSVEATDANGCTATNSATVTEPDRPDVVVVSENAPCEGGDGGTVEVTQVNAGEEPITYTIGDDSNTDGSFANVAPGISVLVATDANNCITEYPVSIVPTCLVPAPSFTPNGDGINDTWTIAGKEEFPRMEVFVYNRWGQRVFKNEGYLDPWNGKTLGVTQPTATYYYVIYYNANEGKKGGFIKGSVTIIR